jgi:MEMO1 family protein
MEKTRKPKFAGMWYPKKKEELLVMLDHFFQEVHSIEEHKEPRGLIVPHAGYVYSGQVAAHSFSLLQENQFDTVILLGSSHRYLENTISIYDGDFYETPLGKVEIDKEITSAILDKHNHFSFHDYIHQAEHSLEAQVPFLQYKLKKFQLVPILTATRNKEMLLLLADVLTDLIKKSDKKILLVCSTDMSHYHSYNVAQKMDEQTIKLILDRNWEELDKSIRLGETELCGYFAMLSFLEVLKKMKAAQGELLCYANSGDAVGDTQASQVVGYMAMVFSQKER